MPGGFIEKMNINNIYGERNAQEEYRDYDAIFKTKTSVPKLPSKYFNRNMLLQVLDKILYKHLTIVCAPAGCGKTTLVGSWINKYIKKCNILWYTLDKEDNDPQIFFRNFSSAIVKSDLCKKNDSIEKIRYYTSKSKIDLLIAIISELPNKVVMVLDDFQCIDNIEILESIRYLLSYIPKNLHVVIISREEPNLPLARMRLHDDLLELKSNDLALTKKEIIEYFQDVMGTCLKDEEAEKLSHMTEGWMAAIRFIAYYIEEHSCKRYILESYEGSKVFIMEYLMQEIFEKQPDSIQKFLLKTSILEIFNGSLCIEVTKDNNTHLILEKLEKDNLLISAPYMDSIYYRYHNLFCEFLRNKLKSTYPYLESELYLNASKWYENVNQVKEAIEFSLKSNNVDNTIRLLDKYWFYMLVNKDEARLISFIEELSCDIIQNNAKLCIIYALAFANKGILGAESKCSNKCKIDLEDKVFDNYKGEKKLIYATISFLSGDKHNSLKLAEDALNHLEKNNFCLYFAYEIILQCRISDGNLDIAESILKKQREEINHIFKYNKKLVDILYKHKVSQIKCMEGDFYNTRIILNDLLNDIPKKEIFNNYLMYCNLGLAYLYSEQCELNLSRQYASKSLSLSLITDDSIKIVQSYIIFARICYMENNYEEAESYIKEVDRICCKFNLKLIIHLWFSDITRILIAIGNFGLLHSMMDKYGIRENEDFLIMNNSHNFAMIDYYIAIDEINKAKYLIEGLSENTISSRSYWDKVYAAILKSKILMRMGQEDAALETFEYALQASYEQEYIYTFISHGRDIREMVLKYINSKKKKDIEFNEVYKFAVRLLQCFKDEGKTIERNNKEIKTKASCLSERELEVIMAMHSGLTNKAIAEMLYISESTVKKHISNIFKKLEVKNRTSGIIAAQKLGLI